MKRFVPPDYENSIITNLIKEYIHDKTDRKILYMRFVDNDTLAEIAEKLNLDTKTVWRHVHDNEVELFKHYPG